MNLMTVFFLQAPAAGPDGSIASSATATPFA